MRAVLLTAVAALLAGAPAAGAKVLDEVSHHPRDGRTDFVFVDEPGKCVPICTALAEVFFRGRRLWHERASVLTDSNSDELADDVDDARYGWVCAFTGRLTYRVTVRSESMAQPEVTRGAWTVGRCTKPRPDPITRAEAAAKVRAYYFLDYRVASVRCAPLHGGKRRRATRWRCATTALRGRRHCFATDVVSGRRKIRFGITRRYRVLRGPPIRCR